MLTFCLCNNFVVLLSEYYLFITKHVISWLYVLVQLSFWVNFMLVWTCRLPDGKQVGDERLELLYTSLYLLIWGEAANLRFMPECICFIFHHVRLGITRAQTCQESMLSWKPLGTIREFFLLLGYLFVHGYIATDISVDIVGGVSAVDSTSYDPPNFLPEIAYLCQMTQELNKMLGRYVGEEAVRDFKPTTCEPNGFLRLVVTPLYEVVAAVSCSFNLVLFCFLNSLDMALYFRWHESKNYNVI